MFLKFDFTNPGVFGKIFWDIFFYIEVKKLTPSNAKERRKEQNAGRNGTPEGTERQKERNARRNRTPEGTERQKERNARRNGRLEGTERRKECCTLMPTSMWYFYDVLWHNTLKLQHVPHDCTLMPYFYTCTPRNAKEHQEMPRNAKGTPMKRKAKGMSCFLLFRGLKRQIF